MFKQSMEFPIAAVSCSSILVYVQPGLFIACWGDSRTCRDLINGRIDSRQSPTDYNDRV